MMQEPLGLFAVITIGSMWITRLYVDNTVNIGPLDPAQLHVNIS